MSEPAPQPKHHRFTRFLRAGVWPTIWFALLIAVIAFVIEPSDSFKNCVHDNKYRSDYNQLYQSGGVFVVLTRKFTRVRLGAYCISAFAEQNERSLGSFAALALAFFTAYLWHATRGLRHYAGIQQPPALISAYLADFFVVDSPEFPTKVGTPPPLDLRNISPYRLPLGIVAMPGGDSDAREMTGFTILGKYQRPQAQSLFFMGFVRYSDIFGNRYISGFCFFYNHPENTWHLAGGEEYNYRRRENESDQPSAAGSLAPIE